MTLAGEFEVFFKARCVKECEGHPAWVTANVKAARAGLRHTQYTPLT